MWSDETGKRLTVNSAMHGPRQPLKKAQSWDIRTWQQGISKVFMQHAIGDSIRFTTVWVPFTAVRHPVFKAVACSLCLCQRWRICIPLFDFDLNHKRGIEMGRGYHSTDPLEPPKLLLDMALSCSSRRTVPRFPRMFQISGVLSAVHIQAYIAWYLMITGRQTLYLVLLHSGQGSDVNEFWTVTSLSA
jgi:hypothetical protein